MTFCNEDFGCDCEPTITRLKQDIAELRVTLKITQTLLRSAQMSVDALRQLANDRRTTWVGRT